MNIAVIPARKGSKRIKNKNIKLFKNRPMIYWTIKAAKDSKLFNKIYVDTDSKKIAKLAKYLGVEVPFLRSKQLANDKVSVNYSTYYFIKNLKKKKLINNFKKKIIFQLMPNCPFRNSNDIKKLFKIFKKKRSNSLVSHNRILFGNPWWSIIFSKKKIVRLFNNSYSKRSQDLPSILVPSGAVWIAKLSFFMKTKTFYGKNYSVGELDWRNSIDIDDIKEFNIAKKL